MHIVGTLMTIDADVSVWGDEQTAAFIAALAALVGVHASAVEAYASAGGSLLMEVRIDAHAAAAAAADPGLNITAASLALQLAALNTTALAALVGARTLSMDPLSVSTRLVTEPQLVRTMATHGCTPTPCTLPCLGALMIWCTVCVAQEEAEPSLVGAWSKWARQICALPPGA